MLTHVEYDVCKLVCSCGVRLAKLEVKDPVRYPLGSFQGRDISVPMIPERVERVELPAERRAVDAATTDRRFNLNAIETAHQQSRHGAGETSPPIGSGSTRTGYRCGKCGADWKWQQQRLDAAVRGALDEGQTVLDASMV